MTLSRTNPLFRTFLSLILRAPDGVEGGGEAAPVIAAPAGGDAPAGEDPPADGVAGENLDVSLLGGAGKEGEDPPAGEGDGEGEQTDEQAAEAEAREAAIARLALPTPETYTVTAPEGFDALDAEALAAATPLFQKLGVKTDAEAQEVVDVFAKEIAPAMLARAAEQTQQAVQQAVNDTKKQWADTARKDPEYGGANFKPNMAIAAKAIDQFGGAELRKVLDETGIGFHPALIKFAVNVGRQLGESDFIVSDASAQETQTTAQKLYSPAFQPQQ